MDNTELHYLSYDPDAIWEEMVAVYMENGGDAIAPGQEVDIFLHGVLAIMTKAFAGVDNALRMSTLRYAVGEYLDMIGENRFCERKRATAAASEVEITFAAGASGELEKGTIVTVDGSLLWQTDEAVSITDGGTATVGITCMETGTIGNGMEEDEELQMIVPINDVVSIVCTEDSAGGGADEDDETYRERIRKNGLYGSTTGTRMQYENKASAVDGVKDVHAWSQTAGTVTISLMIESGYTASDVISAVTSAVSAYDVKPITDTVSVVQAGKRDFSLSVSITLPDNYTPDIGENVSAVIAEYKEWQNSKIGRAYNPGRLSGMLYALGVETVTLSSSTRVAIGEGEYCNVTVTPTIVS